MAQMFSFNQASGVLKLDPYYEAKLTKGATCPSFDQKQLQFNITSDVLGSLIEVITIKVNAKSLAGSFQGFVIAENGKFDISKPKLQITSAKMSSLGQLQLFFNRDFIKPNI